MGDEGTDLFSMAPGSRTWFIAKVVRNSCWVSMREETCASTSKMPVEACWNPVARDARQACFAQNDVPLTRSLQAEVEKPAVRASKDGSLCWEGS